MSWAHILLFLKELENFLSAQHMRLYLPAIYFTYQNFVSLKYLSCKVIHLIFLFFPKMLSSTKNESENDYIHKSLKY